MEEQQARELQEERDHTLATRLAQDGEGHVDDTGSLRR